MAKHLSAILKQYSDVISGKLPASKVSALTTGSQPGVDYAGKMPDERKFVASHSVEMHPDRNGNGDELFKASNIGRAELGRHGNVPQPKDIKIYKQANEEVEFSEKKDEREYGYEGEMAISQIKSIMNHSGMLMKMLKPDTDMPEWVQSKITLASDYIQTAADYFATEMSEETELDEGIRSLKRKDTKFKDDPRKYSNQRPKGFRDPDELSKNEKREMANKLISSFYAKGGKVRKEETELDEAAEKKKKISEKEFNEIKKKHDAGGGGVVRSPKGTLQYKGARHLDFDKDTNNQITQHYSHSDHGLDTVEVHTNKDTKDKKYYRYVKEEVETLDEVMATIDHSWSPRGLTAIRDSLNKNKITHQITTMQHPDGTHLSHITSDHPEFASHMTKLAKKTDTYDPKIYVHGVNEEVNLDEETLSSDHKSAITKQIKNMWGKGNISFNAMKPLVTHSNGGRTHVHSIHMKKGVPHVKHLISMDEEVNLDEAGMPKNVVNHKQDLADMSDAEFARRHGDKSEAKLRSMAWSHGYGKPGTPGHDHYVNRVATGEKKEKLSEAKCNMTEAGTMCEVHGTKACSNEETKSASDKEPRYNGKDKPGIRKLLTDKKNIQEKAESVAQQKLMALALQDKRGEMKGASSEVKKLASSMTEKQLRDYAATKHKGLPRKVQKEQAPAVTPITFPVTNSREGFKL